MTCKAGSEEVTTRHMLYGHSRLSFKVSWNKHCFVFIVSLSIWRPLHTDHTHSFVKSTSKVNTDIAVRENHLTATGNHMPYGIKRYYLPPGRTDFPALTPAEAGTRFTDSPERFEAELNWWLSWPVYRHMTEICSETDRRTDRQTNRQTRLDLPQQ